MPPGQPETLRAVAEEPIKASGSIRFPDDVTLLELRAGVKRSIIPH